MYDVAARCAPVMQEQETRATTSMRLLYIALYRLYTYIHIYTMMLWCDWGLGTLGGQWAVASRRRRRVPASSLSLCLTLGTYPPCAPLSHLDLIFAPLAALSALQLHVGLQTSPYICAPACHQNDNQHLSTRLPCSHQPPCAPALHCRAAGPSQPLPAHHLGDS
jgi:hypothetical protein